MLKALPYSWRANRVRDSPSTTGVQAHEYYAGHFELDTIEYHMLGPARGWLECKSLSSFDQYERDKMSLPILAARFSVETQHGSFSMLTWSC